MCSFGVCEVYSSQAEVCTGILTRGVDFVYISNRLDGTQDKISQLLNDKIKDLEDIIATHDKDCVDLVFSVVCYYYLPTCGNFTHPLPPSSLCQEECLHVQNNCPATWQAAKIAFTDPPFIDCGDTTELLFPLPNCCTGANILSKTSSDGNGAAVAGAVVGAVVGTLLFVILAVLILIVIVVLVFMYFKGSKRKQLARMQLDIMAL